MDKVIELSETVLQDDKFSELFSQIRSIEFSLLSADEIKRQSYAHITETKLEGEGSVNDERLGVIKNGVDCVTCGGQNLVCPGHFGHIELTVPVMHPLFTKEILSFLMCKCDKCKALLMSPAELKTSKLKRLRGTRRFEAICEYIKDKHKTCSIGDCKNTIQPKYKVENKRFYKCSGPEDPPLLITSEEILEIFDAYSNADLVLLGLKPEVHPAKMVIQNLPVLPLCARPYVETAGVTCDDDLTTKYIEILKLNNKLKIYEGVKLTDSKKHDQNELLMKLEEAIWTLMDNSAGKAKHNNKRPLKCIAQRLKGKGGRFRGNLSAKRVDNSGRSPIGPDPYVRADEIAIPNSFARKLSFPERVNNINYQELTDLVNSGQVNYIINKERGRTNMADYLTPSLKYLVGFKFQPGDALFKYDSNGKKVKMMVYDNWMTSDKGFAKYGPLNLQIHAKSPWTHKVQRGPKGTPLLIPKNTEQVRFTLTHEDVVERTINDGDQTITKKYNIGEMQKRGEKFYIMNGDRVFRKGVELENVIVEYKKKIVLKMGDIVERHLKDYDIILFNRQPSLHKGSLIARKIRIFPERSRINGWKPIKTIRFNLSMCKTYNADFDGDEMNVFAYMSYESKAEALELSSTESLIKSGQSSRVLLSLEQDTLTGLHYYTRGEKRTVKDEKGNQRTIIYPRVKIDKETFNDTCCVVSNWETSDIVEKMDHIRQVQEWKGIENADDIYHGHGLISMLLPDDFEYECKVENNHVIITQGVIIQGILTKACGSGNSYNSIIHKIEKDYGAKRTVDFISDVQMVISAIFSEVGFSVGIEDFPTTYATEIEQEVVKSLMEATSVARSEMDPEIRERKINTALNNSEKVGKKIAVSNLDFDNRFKIMVQSGAKGSEVNIAQIMAMVAQQNVDGKRIPANLQGRTLPHYGYESDYHEDKLDESLDLQKDYYESGGFIANSYIKGLNVKQYFKHAQGGREGVIDTAIKTSRSGYVQRKLVKKMEDLRVSYNNMITNAQGNIVQMMYGNNMDPARLVKVGNKTDYVNIQGLANKFNADIEFKRYQKNKTYPHKTSSHVVV